MCCSFIPLTRLHDNILSGRIILVINEVLLERPSQDVVGCSLDEVTFLGNILKGGSSSLGRH
ncbi:wsv261 [White spot syndrome virus]|uniref:Wsv261 n=4 Tax=White spot syndrome virus TaxID=342409 RepID=Q8VAW4_WSSVS|nr:wsv261 [Shrimp white spot syndrome virus]AFX59635.1 wsv261 [White spot syndrome virus]AAL33264.1 wsv261 [Shrimp white spot syndrome virus]AAL89184.1 WSSV316 [Shrimp white spot syndrome virus]AWQ60837.1 wsv261 [Shrimp white spot syndrome virus]AWQ61255.1 wsv261 [Shrimp white spot syndrome virus]